MTQHGASDDSEPAEEEAPLRSLDDYFRMRREPLELLAALHVVERDEP